MWRHLLPAIFLGLFHFTIADVRRATRLGPVLGKEITVLGTTVEQYLSIPFAEPPLGRLRFRPPLPARPWVRTYDARSRRTACPQPMFPEAATNGIEYTENCLHLNVWTSRGRSGRVTRLAPVLVWIYGGGFNYGTASDRTYNGSILAAVTGHVVVSMNYRLSIFGFLHTPSNEAPGNNGFMDQALALMWVQDNIQYFGGDPSTVTLFGESAGAVSIHAHLLSPISRGLFRRAVLLSGNLYAIDFYESPMESMAKGNRIATMAGCAHEGQSLASHPHEVLACLRNVPADELVTLSYNATKPKPNPFWPTSHNQFLPFDPRLATELGLFSNVSIISGVTSDEMSWMLDFPPSSELLKKGLNTSTAANIRETMTKAVGELVRIDIPFLLQNYINDTSSESNLGLVRRYVDYISDRFFNCPAHIFASAYAAWGNKVFSYVFDHRPSNTTLPAWTGAPHASDLPFLFGFPLVDAGTSPAGSYRASKELIQVLSSFAECGRPTLSNAHAWPPYTENNPVSVVLGSGTCTLIHGHRVAKCQLWKSFLKPRIAFLNHRQQLYELLRFLFNLRWYAS